MCVLILYDTSISQCLFFGDYLTQLLTGISSEYQSLWTCEDGTF